MQLRRIPLRLSVTLALSIALGACAPVKEQQETVIDPEISRAQSLMAQQDYLAASSLYRELASRYSGSLAQDLRLAAADAALKGNDLATAATLLEQTGEATLDSNQALLQRLLHAELALAQRRADRALQMLQQQPPQASQRLDLRQRYQRDLADTYRQQGKLLQAAIALQGLDALQVDVQQRLQTQTDILRTLTALNAQLLQDLQAATQVDGHGEGWLALALLGKRLDDDAPALQAGLQRWRTRFPDHPALPELLATFSERLRLQARPPAQVAVLLPQSGPYAGVATALRDGIMISHYAQPADKRTRLLFYDSSDSTQTWPLYSEAVAAGAEMVVGPLQKEALVQLARAGELPVPVLALNQVQTDSIPPANLFMFALSPEDEARQAAERIWLDGRQRPAMLVPEDDWGSRIANAFNARWRSLAGEPAELRTYDPDSSDYSAAITSLLLLDRSEARHQEMQRWLGQRLEFEPRRRADVDAIFIAARPRQAQSFPPQLQFHHAADLPLYATSHAWSGELSAQQLADMRGMILADIPLLVAGGERERLAAFIPEVGGSLVRLHAMGMDALNLLPQLRRLQSSPYESLDGQTGNLFMDAENRILRQTVWLKLDQPPQILGYAARLDLHGYAPAGQDASPSEPIPVITPQN